jgi:hypothetical protein
MKVKAFKQIIESAVRKVVKEELSNMISELKQTDDSIKTERSLDDEVSLALSSNKLESDNSTTKKQKFTNDNIINSILNETYEDGGWRTIDKTSSDAMNFDGRGANIPMTDIEGRPVNPDELPDGVKSAMTKDYSKLLKKSKEISKRKG